MFIKEVHGIQRQRESAKHYILRNKARSYFSTTFLLRKPEAEPERTRPPLWTTSRALSFLLLRLASSGERNDLGGSGPDKSRGRHLGESLSFVRVFERTKASRGENAAADISAGLIGYLYAALITWPLRKDAREPFVELSISGGFGSWATTPFGEALCVVMRGKRKILSLSPSLSFICTIRWDW